MFPEFVQDLVHLEGSHDGFDKNGSLDGTRRNPDLLFRQNEDVVPESGLQMAFHLREVVIRTRALFQKRPGGVIEAQPEIEESACDNRAGHKCVLLRKMEKGTGPYYYLPKM